MTSEQQREGPPTATIKSLLNPAYEPGDGSADGAQLVDGEWWNPAFGCDSLQMVVDNARAALARFGHQPTPPAEGEVAELVVFLTPSREQAGAISFDAFIKLRRAAELLQQQHPTPVPVSERLLYCDRRPRLLFGH
jgi:hypothetical protein